MEKVHGKPQACTRCGEAGHNARSCTGDPLTAEQVAERVRVQRRASYARNRVAIAEAHRKYYEANKAKILVRSSAYQKRNRAKANAKYRNKWQSDEEFRERKRRWREANVGRQRGYVRKHYKLNREKRLESMRRWREANPEKAAEADRRWRAANQDKVRAKALLRDYRSATANGRASAGQIRARVHFYGNACSYCGGAFEHMDHTISLARGGTNWPANLRPACEKCNLSKCAKPLRQFLREVGYVTRALPLP